MAIKLKQKFKNILADLYKDPARGLFLRLKKRKGLKIGLKSCWHAEQLETRFRHQPKIIELYLYDGDLENYLREIERTIRKIKQQGIEIVIHQPEHYRGEVMTIASINNKITKTAEQGYNLLYKLCQKHQLKGFIMHPYSGNLDKPNVSKIYKKLDKNRFIKNLKAHPEWQAKILLENMTVGFFKSKENIQEITEKTKIKLCLDLCHLYITYKSNHKLKQILKGLQKHIDYYHIVDSKGRTHDSLEIGQGDINFRKIKKYIKQGIIEVNCQNQVTADEMIRSYYIFQDYYQKTELLSEIPIKINRFIKNLASAARFF